VWAHRHQCAVRAGTGANSRRARAREKAVDACKPCRRSTARAERNRLLDAIGLGHGLLLVDADSLACISVRAGLESGARTGAGVFATGLLGVAAMPRISCAGFGNPERAL